MMTQEKLQKKRKRQGLKRKFMRRVKARVGPEQYEVWKSERWMRKAEIKAVRKMMSG